MNTPPDQPSGFAWLGFFCPASRSWVPGSLLRSAPE
jgi:hypothetical protein